MKPEFQDTLRMVAQVSDTPENRLKMQEIALFAHSNLKGAGGFTVVKYEQVHLCQMVKPNGVEITDPELTKQPECPGKDLRIWGANARDIIRNCHLLMLARYRKRTLWSMVADVTGHGSGYSIEICRSANLDPHQTLGSGELKDLPKPTGTAAPAAATVH